MRRPSNHVWALVLPALVATLLAATGAQAQAPAAMAIPSQRYQLANGLDVILHQDRSIPIVHVNVTYHVGGGNERPGQSGYAHLFEHLMFRGSKHVGQGQFDVVLRDIGARGNNGSTYSGYTNYYQSVPANQLETVLWLESDRMGYLLLNQQELDTQREVVRNERRSSHENVPYSQEYFAAARALYVEGHPYRYLTIGRHEDLQLATLEDARTFFARWYVPANATLVLAGDFEPAAVRPLIDKWFGTFPVSTKPVVRVPPAPALGDKVRERFTDALATTTRVRYVWPTPPFLAPGDAELDLIAHLLASDAGRLRKLLFYDKALATVVTAYQTSRAFSSEFHIVVDVQPGVDVGEVESTIRSSVDALARESVSERELKQAVVAREVAAIRGLETLAARASTLQMYAHYGREPDSVAWDLERYRKVTAEDIRTTVGRLLTDKRVEIVTVPAAARAVRASGQAARPLELQPRPFRIAPLPGRGGR